MNKRGTGNGEREAGRGKRGAGSKGKDRAPKTRIPSAATRSPFPAPHSPTFAGFAAIIGAPNAGKSTLLNRMIGQKVSIVSPKAQTTRIRTLGIMSEGDTQISFVDTPGIFAAKSRLDTAMVKAAWSSLDDADAIVLLVDATKRLDEKIELIIEELYKRFSRDVVSTGTPLPLAGLDALRQGQGLGRGGGPSISEAKNHRQGPHPLPPAREGRGSSAATFVSKPPIILALNKVDAIEPAKLLPLAAQLNDTGVFSDVFMISAKTGDGVEDLKVHLKKQMPESPWFFGEDQISDLPSQIMAAELTREQLYLQLQQELPYGAAVLPESLEEKRDGSVVIRQTIVVARDNHRAMILGKGGARIKSIGEKARADITDLFDRKVHLFLNVKTDEKWQDRPDFYRTFGLEFGKK